MTKDVKSGLLEFSDDQKVFVAVDEDDDVKKAVLIDREGNETALGALPTDEQVQEAVDAWLDDHPEATTTVQDGAITTAKLANGSVTDDKLAADGIKAEVSDLKTDFKDTTLLPVTPKWSRKVGAATGVFTTGNGATIHELSIDSVETIEIASGSKASLFLYRTETYIGKINANYQVDKIAGSWGFYTGRINIADILKANNCDGVVITIVPTDGTTLTDGTVETWGNAHCKVYKKFYMSDWATTKQISTTWRRGAYASDCWTFNGAVNCALSDFIKNVGSILVTSNTKVCVYFYSKLQPVGRLAPDGTLTKNPNLAWGYYFREINISRYLESQFANADSIQIALSPIDGTSLASDEQATSFANANCVVLQSAVTSYPTFESITKPTKSFIKAINHRGFNRFAPENTLPAYAMTKKAGFDSLEADLDFTSDGIPVMLHDGSINRTARNSDGTTIDSTINIGSITYEQALTYDFGIWKSAKYAGTKIPTLEQTLLLCKRLGLELWLDIKIPFTDAQAELVANIVKGTGMSDHIIFMCGYITTLEKMEAVFPKATLLTGLTGYTEEAVSSTIESVNALKTDDNNVLVSCYQPSLSDSIDTQLYNAGVNCIVWEDINYDLTIPFKKCVIGGFTDLYNVGDQTIEYELNQY